LRPLSYRLLRRWVSLEVADRVGDFVPLQSQRMLQNHLDRGSYVEKKVVRGPDKYKSNGQSNPCADRRASHRIFSFVRRASYA